MQADELQWWELSGIAGNVYQVMYSKSSMNLALFRVGDIRPMRPLLTRMLQTWSLQDNVEEAQVNHLK